MNHYETHIGKVENSTFAIGENARAQGNVDWHDRDDLEEALAAMISIASGYSDPVADEVVELAQTARREISAEKPAAEPFRRLTEAARRLMSKLGAGLVEAGALAEAVAKISDVIHRVLGSESQRAPQKRCRPGLPGSSAQVGP